jgi:hypothetical protein
LRLVSARDGHATYYTALTPEEARQLAYDAVSNLAGRPSI